MRKKIITILLTATFFNIAFADDTTNIAVSIDNIILPLSVKITKLNNLQAGCFEIDNIPPPNKAIINFDPNKDPTSPCYKDKEFSLWVMKGSFGKFSKLGPHTISSLIHTCWATWDVDLITKLSGFTCT